MVQKITYPGPWDDWARKKPHQVDMNASRLDEAIGYAKAHETSWSNNMADHFMNSEFHNDLIGPIKDRGQINGLILRHGYVVAEWGDTRRVDMTFSISKSYLSTIAGLALDRGLICDVHDPVIKYVDDGGFDSSQNASISWHHLLQQTSEWEGTLWDKPYYADSQGNQGADTVLQAPGSVYAYNDVRVNRLALSLLRVWRQPLPQVLKNEVMDPIGASPTWQWHGYRNSWVTIDGLKMQSVSGGGHWGGGVWISTRDQAHFGYLFLRRGRWQERQIISERWIDLATTPCPVNPAYGYMWWLNTNRQLFPSAPQTSFYALGAGRNLMWVDPDHDLVVVVRWIEPDSCDEFMKHVLAALN
jgi:CubicO group peptidase (beta-lactamase class C family)